MRILILIIAGWIGTLFVACSPQKMATATVVTPTPVRVIRPHRGEIVRSINLPG